MTDLTVRTYPYYGRVRALVIFNGEDYYGEGATVGEALMELGNYLNVKEREQTKQNQEMKTLMGLVKEGTSDEIRGNRQNG